MAEPLLPWIRTRNTTVRSKTNSSLYWTWDWNEDKDEHDLHTLVKPWSNTTWHLNDTWVVCQRFHAVRRNLPSQCCYAINAESDADLPNSQLVSTREASNGLCDSRK